jgi:hypothetical protein
MLQRYVVNPIAEIVLGVREAFSPEMREIRQRTQIAKIRDQGTTRYTLTQAAIGTLAIVAFDMLSALGRVLGGKRSWDSFIHAASVWQYLVVGVVGFLFFYLAVLNSIDKLRKKYPEEFSGEA